MEKQICLVGNILYIVHKHRNVFLMNQAAAS